MRSNSTPTSTRTYQDREQRQTSAYFNAERRAQLLDPSPDEMEACLKAAVCMFSYNAAKGKKSPFPTAWDVIDSYMGIDNEDDISALKRKISHKMTIMLKFSHKIKQQIENQIDSGITDYVKLRCPECDEQTITCHIGTLPTYDSDTGQLIPQNDLRMVAAFFDCYCEWFTLDTYNNLEQQAIDKYIANNATA